MRTDKNMQLAKRIKHLRAQRGIKQVEMAQGLHMDPSSYSRIESGETAPAVERLQEIAEILHVPMEYFLSNEPVVVHIEHISGGANANGYQSSIEQRFPEEWMQRLVDRYEAHVKELQTMLSRVMELLDRKLK